MEAVVIATVRHVNSEIMGTFLVHFVPHNPLTRYPSRRFVVRITGDIGDTESIYVSTELDIFGRTKQIVTQTELCSIDSLTMTSDDDYTPECPSQGVLYTFEKYFTIPTSSYLSSVYFTPSVQVSFASDSTQGSMDLGCAISSEGAEMGKAPSSGIALSSAKKWVLGVGFTFLAACMSVLVFFALRRRPDEPKKTAAPKYQVTMVTRKQKMSGFEYRGDAISA
eukprot:scaffold4850_cov50-Attheya_sp.AAC.4